MDTEANTHFWYYFANLFTGKDVEILFGSVITIMSTYIDGN